MELVILGALLAGLYVYSKVDKVDSTGKIEEKDADIDLDSETAEVLKGYTNIAIFGLDNRHNGKYDGGNSDCIMIASINNDTKKVKLLSIYRDTFLSTKEGAYNKINSAYATGGARGAVAALNRNLNLDITNYISVDFRALVDAVDLIDGVEVTLTDQEAQIMNDNYIDEINQVAERSSSRIEGGGTYTLDGVQTLAYCRIRYTTGLDFKRTERQREVLMKMFEKTKSVGIGTLTSLIDKMFDEVSTSYTSGGLIELASSLMDYEVEDSHGWPFELCTGVYGSKGDLVVPTDLKTNVEELHEYLFNEENTVSAAVNEISDYIVNYTGCTTEATSRFDNPLTGDDNTSSDPEYVPEEDE